MKKLFVLIISCLVLSMIFSACSKSTENKEKITNLDSNVTASEGEDTFPSNEPVVATKPDSGLLDYTYRVPGTDFTIDMPNFQFVEHGFTTFLLDGGTKYVAFTCILDEQIDNVEVAHNRTLELFEFNVTSHDRLQKVDNVIGENVTVNGIDAYRFEGTSASSSYDVYTYGYSFVYQGKACSIVGVVNDESQPEEEKALVKNIVDAMLVSIKST